MIDDKRIEKVARSICENLGLDPDEGVDHGYGDTMTPSERLEELSGVIPMVLLRSPQWCMYRAQAANAIATQEAMKECEV